MQITFWGVRGSFPAPGLNSVHFGGNTPCVQVIDTDTDIIIDAGTGLYTLGKEQSSHRDTYHLVFSHIHWDHIQGLPYFAPLYDPASRINLFAPVNCIDLLRNMLTGDSRYAYLPNPPGLTKAQLQFKSYQSGENWSIGNIKISAVELNHPCHSFGLRFDSQGKSFVYYSDTAPFDDILFGSDYLPRAPRLKPTGSDKEKLDLMRRAAVELCRNTDLLIHDAHFTSEEYPRFAHFGHSTPQHALDIAIAARVKTLVLYHHAPDRSDHQLAEIETEYRSAAHDRGIALHAAREGERIDL